MVTLTAIFEDGVLKPTTPLSLPDRTEVSIIVEVLNDEQGKAEKLALLTPI